MHHSIVVALLTPRKIDVVFVLALLAIALHYLTSLDGSAPYFPGRWLHVDKRCGPSSIECRRFCHPVIAIMESCGKGIDAYYSVLLSVQGQGAIQSMQYSVLMSRDDCVHCWLLGAIQQYWWEWALDLDWRIDMEWKIKLSNYFVQFW